MDKRIEYYGATIDIVDVLSGIQQFVEGYFGTVISGLTDGNGGVVYASSVYNIATEKSPAYLYMVGNALYLDGLGTYLIFPKSPNQVIPLTNNMLVSSNFQTLGIALVEAYVHARYTTTTGGILKRIASGLVYNNSSGTTGYSELLDSIFFEITATQTYSDPTISSVCLGKVTYSPTLPTPVENQYINGSFLFDVSPTYVNIVKSGILPSFKSRFLELNSALTDLTTLAEQTAGFKVNINSTVAAELLLSNAGGSWFFNSSVPLGGPDPTANTHYATKQWVVNYITSIYNSLPDPNNLRIINFTSANNNSASLVPNSTASMAALQPPINIINVNLAWGYDVFGVGGSNSFTVDSSINLTGVSLSGYYLWLPTYSKNLVIVSQSGNILTVKNLDLTPWDGTGITITSANLASIHCNADKYVITAVTQISGVYDNSSATIAEVHNVDGTIAGIKGTIQLIAGNYYKIGVMAYGLNTKSNYVLAPSMPVLVVPPTITNDGVLSVNATTYGFNAAISGWAAADFIEFIWSSDPGGAAFNNFTTTYHSTSPFQSITIPTNTSATYDIKARPLVAGFVVAPYLDKKVVSGGGGNLPHPKTLIIPFSLSTYSGTTSSVTSVTPTIYKVSFLASALYIPSGQTLYTSDILHSNMVGLLLTDSAGKTFTIQQVASTYVLVYSSTSLSPASGSFTIGTDLASRFIYQTTLDNSYTVTSMNVTTNILFGTGGVSSSAILRVYQLGFASTSGNVTVSEMTPSQTNTLNVPITDQAGNLSLVVDGFDPATGTFNNYTCIKGTITLTLLPNL